MSMARISFPFSFVHPHPFIYTLHPSPPRLLAEMEMPPRLTPSRLTKLSLFFILLYTLHVLRSRYLFESYLNSSQISYADFPLSYQIALNESLATKTPLVYDNSLLPTKSEDETIAPTIHFIWFRDLYPEQLHRADHSSKIPHEGSDAADSCRKNSPDFSVKVWNSSSVLELLTSSYPSFLPTYLSYPHPIQRIDAAKYFIIYHHGGVYIEFVLFPLPHSSSICLY